MNSLMDHGRVVPARFEIFVPVPDISAIPNIRKLNVDHGRVIPARSQISISVYLSLRFSGFSARSPHALPPETEG
jgi:hypothetical protein